MTGPEDGDAVETVGLGPELAEAAAQLTESVAVEAGVGRVEATNVEAVEARIDPDWLTRTPGT